MQFDIPKKESSIIKVLGVGGGGSNAVNHMFKTGIKGVDFAICNTDIQSMDSSEIEVKLQLGPITTEGRGAGSIPEVGKEACIESIDSVRDFLSNNTKMVFITAGLGGGTGTGAAPIIAKAAKDMGILTIAIVTLPFKFEGTRRIRQAYEGLEDLKKNVDSILIISNDKLRMMYGNLPISEAFAYADDILTTAAKGIAEIITIAGYINVDFEDVNTVMRESGITVMGSASAEGENRAVKAVEAALSSPLLEDNDIRGAKHILLNITSGTKEVTMDEIGEITEYIQGEAGYGTDLIWGNCVNENQGEKINVTVIATGFETNNSDNKETSKKEKLVVKLDDDTQRKTNDIDLQLQFDDDNSFNIVDFEVDDVKDTIDAFSISTSGNDEFEVKDDRERRLEKLRLNLYAKKSKNSEATNKKVSLDSPNMIHKYESEPAYKRKQVQLEKKSAKHDMEQSNYRVGIDEDEPLERNNRFLHDNVD